MKNLKDTAFSVGKIDTEHVDVLDGIRAFAVLIVVWFHFWQQSWLQDFIKPDVLQKFGIADAGVNWIPRTGYVFVDMMILLSGFCLFLPHAREMIEKTPRPSAGKFYARRVARIFPSYYLCILVFLLFFVRVTDYSSSEMFWHDLRAQLTFTQMLKPETYMWTKFNAALWTVCVEMQFYLIFPLVAWFFKKKPVLTYIAMCCCSWIYYVAYVLPTENISMRVNQFPTFLCVYANGMMAALIFVYIANNLRHGRYSGIFFTGLAIFSLYFIRIMLKYNLAYKSGGQEQVWQVQNRFALSLMFTLLIIGAAFSFKWLRWIFSNRVMRFLSGISFNLYIWHQVICLRLKEWKIPYWEAENGYPQMSMGREWQWKYTAVIWTVSLVFASLVTYLFERPVDKLLMKGYKCLDAAVRPAAERIRRKFSSLLNGK